MMEKKMGRPPSSEPKLFNTRIRTSQADVDKLNYCCDVLKLSRAEIIRQGLDYMYQKARQQEKEETLN